MIIKALSLSLSLNFSLPLKKKKKFLLLLIYFVGNEEGPLWWLAQLQHANRPHSLSICIVDCKCLIVGDPNYGYPLDSEIVLVINNVPPISLIPEGSLNVLRMTPSTVSYLTMFLFFPLSIRQFSNPQSFPLFTLL